MQCPVPSLLSESLRFASQQCRSITLVEEVSVHDQLHHHHNTGEITGPSPARIADGKSTSNNWADGWTTHERDGIAHHRNPPVFRRPDITQHAARRGDRGAAKESREETRYENRLNVPRRAGRKREYRSNKIWLGTVS